MEDNKAIEILKNALLLEKRGKAFYSQVASNASDPDVAQIFEIMADEEKEHIKQLSEQFKHLKQHKKFKDTDIPDTDSDTSSQVLSDKIKDKISAASFEAAAISAAIDMETRAIEVYTKRSKETDDPEEKKFYKWLANWEKGHHKILFELDNDLKEKIWSDNHFWPS